MPITALGICLLMRFLPRVDPGRANYNQFVTAFSTFRIGVIATIGAIYAITQLSIHGYSANINLLVPMAVGILLILVGNLLSKIRPNWFIGIRTPWTLSSKTSWDKTHRVGGWLCIAAGLLLMINGALPAPWNVIEGLGVGLGLVASLFIYSYVVWRTASDKVPPAGTSPVA
jgi:uncharacterized membrane protein